MYIYPYTNLKLKTASKIKKAAKTNKRSKERNYSKKKTQSKKYRIVTSFTQKNEKKSKKDNCS